MGTPTRAIVRYARISNEEKALELCRKLRAAGIDATAQYANGQPEAVAINGDYFTWDDVLDVAARHDTRPRLKVVRLPHGADLPLPAYETAGAAGMDLRAAIPEEAPVTLLPGQRQLIPAGIAFAIPVGYEVQVRPRSGLALKHGISVVNSPGTVDSDYRGEVGVVLINQGQEAFTVRRGDRIGQMVVCPVVQGVWEEVEALDATARGASGYGSTGRG